MLARDQRQLAWHEDAATAAAIVDDVLGRRETSRVCVRTLGEILSDPAARQAPRVVAPRLAYGGRTTLLASREKCGKSTLVSAAGAHVTRGAAWLGDETPRGSVLIAALEEHVHDVAQRCESWSADPDHTHIVESLPSPALTSLYDAVRQVQPSLLIVDTLAALVGHLSDRPDPGSSTGWQPIMAALEHIARDTDTAVLVLAHARKSDNTYRDSTAIGAGVDVIIEMSDEGQDTGVRRMRVRARLPGLGDYSVRLTDDGYVLESGELSLDARVLEYVRAHPNASQRAVRDAVRARGHAVDSTVARLLRAGVLIDMGSDARHRYRVRDAVPPELFAARARRAMRADRTAAARRIARWLAEQVRQVAPPGLGYWPDAWQLVDAPSGAFLDALADWQASGSAADQQRAQTTAAAVLAAWRAAAEQWPRRAGPWDAMRQEPQHESAAKFRILRPPQRTRA